MRSPHRLPVFAALLTFAGLLVAQAGAEEPAPAGSVQVLEHDVSVRFVPKEHRLVAEDRITVEAPAAGASLDLDLAETLVVADPVEVGDRKVSVKREGGRLVGIPLPAGRSTVLVRYAGTVYDPVKKAGTLTWVTGDHTSGLVGEEGIYLVQSSRWVPRAPGEALARYHVTAYVPDPFQVVTQGGVPERTTLKAQGLPADGAGVCPAEAPRGAEGPTTLWNVLKAKAQLPTDSLTLVAGPYHTQSRKVDGVEIATWFFEERAADGALWLDDMQNVVRRYSRMLGTYPHGRFDIVSNFFSSGYGMPGFTLLGADTLAYVTQMAKRPGGKIPPGYLDHEYVHGWYGNGLFVDYARGNWCEGLTTYCSNYYAKELESAAEGLAHRRSVLERFSLRIHGERDVPVRRFMGKVEDTDNDVGYGKASLIFHMARRELGERTFWLTLREFTQARLGTVVSWDDWFAAFDAAQAERAAKGGGEQGGGPAPTPVSSRLKPYLDRAGLPELTQVKASVSAGEGGQRKVTLSAEQAPASDGGGPWPLTIEVELEGVVGDAKTQRLDLSSGKGEVVVQVPTLPRTVVFDPGYHVLRRIAEIDVPPSLEATLEAGRRGPTKGVVVWQGGGEEHFRPLAERLVATRGFEIKAADFDVAGYAGPAVVLRVAPEGERKLVVGGTTYEDATTSALVSTREGGRARTTFTALSADAASRAGRLPFYGWDPWVVFQGGRPVARAPRSDERPSTLIVLDAAPRAGTSRVQSDLEQLCSPAFEGRWPGSKGHELCRQWLGEQLKAWVGADAAKHTFVSRFEIPALERRSSRALSLVPEEGAPVVLENAFRPFSFSPVRDASVQAAQSCEVVEWSGTDPVELALDRNKREVGIVAYVLAPEAAAALAPFLDAVNDLTPESERELAKPGRDGKARPRPPLAPWIAGQRMRRAPYLDKTDRTTIAVSPEVGAQLKAALDKEQRVQFAIDWAPATAGNTLVASSVPIPQRRAGSDAKKTPVVVLMAHFDSFGKQPGGAGGAAETLWVGADDNASGVACLLETLRNAPAASLSASADAPGVVVLFTDGEEWGLRGAYEAVKDLSDAFDVRAVLNVDSVGRGMSKPTHVIGLSTYPEASALVKQALEAEKIPLGADVDKYAYEHGSDHYPFHMEGIPAVTLWASDYVTQNTGADTLDKVEAEGIVRLARALASLLTSQRSALAATKAAR